ncbi:MAG: retroviral-like aspartic protease family protein [Cyanobacteria bacterium P01_D01_bin.105]
MGLSQSICRLVLLPSAVGIISYGCGTLSGALIRQSAVEQPAVEQSTSEAVIPKTIEPDITPQRQETRAGEATYQEGINLASGAHNLSQSAVSPDDWGLVASRWQRAADQLKLINADSEHYPAAQSKIAEYSRNAQYAKTHIASLQAAARAPLPPLSPGTVVRPTRPDQSALQASTQMSGTSAIQTETAQIEPIQTEASQSSYSRLASTVSVPIIRRLHGTPVVQVMFNDSKTYEMILDTGASRTLITRAMANELGVVPNDRMIAATASEAQVAFDLGQMRSISIESVRLSNAQVSIGDSVDIGLLGNDFLRGYDVTIRAREIELSPTQS